MLTTHIEHTWCMESNVARNVATMLANVIEAIKAGLDALHTTDVGDMLAKGNQHPQSAKSKKLRCCNEPHSIGIICVNMLFSHILDQDTAVAEAFGIDIPLRVFSASDLSSKKLGPFCLDKHALDALMQGGLNSLRLTSCLSGITDEAIICVLPLLLLFVSSIDGNC
jgi:hypothetical protein